MTCQCQCGKKIKKLDDINLACWRNIIYEVKRDGNGNIFYEEKGFVDEDYTEYVCSDCYYPIDYKSKFNNIDEFLNSLK